MVKIMHWLWLMGNSQNSKFLIHLRNTLYGKDWEKNSSSLLGTNVIYC
jgi:hypothetical protein